MSWCKSDACQELRKGCCNLAAHVAKLSRNQVPVTEEECRTCLESREPTVDEPNETVASLAVNAVDKHQPWRASKLRGRLAGFLPAEVTTRAYTEADFPCPHRRERTDGRIHQCTPCDGGVAHPVKWCSKLMRDCTVMMAPRMLDENDGKPGECCLGCDFLPKPDKNPDTMSGFPLRAREVKRRIEYIRRPSGERAGDHWANRYAGQSVFLVCGGPSLKSMPLDLLNQRGITVAAINNAGEVVRPHLWFSADGPQKFYHGIFADPACAKFVKSDQVGAATENAGPPPYSFPNVWVYERQTDQPVAAESFLRSSRPVWRQGHFASTMLFALRMLIDFGFRTIYLMGCDFQMDPANPYAANDPCDDAKAAHNNALYSWMNGLFPSLRPILEAAGVSVLNCTPGGNLGTFDRIDFTEAIGRTAVPEAA